MSATFRQPLSTRIAAAVIAASLAAALFGCAAPRPLDDSYYVGQNSQPLGIEAASAAAQGA